MNSNNINNIYNKNKIIYIAISMLITLGILCLIPLLGLLNKGLFHSDWKYKFTTGCSLSSRICMDYIRMCGTDTNYMKNCFGLGIDMIKYLLIIIIITSVIKMFINRYIINT